MAHPVDHHLIDRLLADHVVTGLPIACGGKTIGRARKIVARQHIAERLCRNHRVGGKRNRLVDLKGALAGHIEVADRLDRRQRNTVGIERLWRTIGVRLTDRLVPADRTAALRRRQHPDRGRQQGEQDGQQQQRNDEQTLRRIRRGRVHRQPVAERRRRRAILRLGGEIGIDDGQNRYFR